MSDHGEWLPLWQLVANSADDHAQLDDLKRTWIDALDHKCVRYRHQIAANGEHGAVADDPYYRHADDLPELFWQSARIHWPWNSATWGSRTVVNVEVFVGEAESLVGESESRNDTPRPEPAISTTSVKMSSSQRLPMRSIIWRRTTRIMAPQYSMDCQNHRRRTRNQTRMDQRRRQRPSRSMTSPLTCPRTITFFGRHATHGRRAA